MIRKSQSETICSTKYLFCFIAIHRKIIPLRLFNMYLYAQSSQLISIGYSQSTLSYVYDRNENTLLVMWFCAQFQTSSTFLKFKLRTVDSRKTFPLFCFMKCNRYRLFCKFPSKYKISCYLLNYIKTIAPISQCCFNIHFFTYGQANISICS